MKYHALAWCLVSSLAAGTAGAAEQHSSHMSNDRTQSTYSSRADHEWTVGPSNQIDYADIARHRRALAQNGHTSYWESRSQMSYFPDLPSEQYVADKVAEIVRNQQTEIAHLAALAPRARTAGFENVSSVYDFMIRDHRQLADFGIDWLQDRGYPVPAEPTTVNIADMTPAQSVDHVLQMHVDAFNRSLEQRKNEKSSTVRGMLLWAAASTLRHIDILRTLDRDVDAGRTALSQTLRFAMEPGYRSSDQTALLSEMTTESFGEFTTITETTTTTIAEAPAQTPYVIPAPTVVAEAPVTERIVERPVVVERVVERPVFRTRPQFESRVAGKRQTTRARRPAK